MEVLFCTIVSKYRLFQCVAMYRSLKLRMKEAALAVLAVDEESARVLETLRLTDLIVITADKLEDNELLELKKERTYSEYCWTLKPVLLLYLYERYEEVRIFTYLDSDLFFFDNPMKLFRIRDKWSVLLTTHKVNRKTNGGFAAFMRNSQAYEALKWWDEKCREWCYYRHDNGRFADQGYLDVMRKKYRGVLYIDIPGSNAASWNYYKYDFEIKDNKVYINKNRLIFYHFSGLRLKRHETTVAIHGAEAPCILCGIYMDSIKKAIKDIEEVSPEVTEYFYLGI